MPLLDRVDPGRRRLFSGGARLGSRLVDEIVERQIGFARRFRNQMPFCRFDRIGFYAEAVGKDDGEAILGDGVARSAALRNSAAAIG